MHVDDYQKQAARTLLDKPPFTMDDPKRVADMRLIRESLLVMESFGKLMEYVKKVYFHQHPNTKEFRLLLRDFKADVLNIEARAALKAEISDFSSMTDQQIMLLWALGGMIGETGEVITPIEEYVFRGKELDLNKLTEEIGDGNWYGGALCTKAGIRLSDVLRLNLEKLLIRFPDGFNTDDSLKRVDVNGATE